MRHLHGYRKFSMTSAHRRAMFRNMATSFVKEESIKTTLQKAKELRSIVEKLITLGKRGDLHARRRAASYFFDKEAVKKTFDELGPRFKDRPGGYTRIFRHGFRFGDGAELATIQLVDFGETKEDDKKKVKTTKKTKKKK